MFNTFMTLTPLETFLMIGDFSVALILVILFISLYISNHCTKATFFAFWIGCLIGATWEFTFLFLGEGFLHPINPWPFGLSGWPRKLSHSIWDGGIFVLGIGLCNLILKSSKNRFMKFSWKELLIMLGWGIFQELLVEYLFNGKIWQYEPLPWNPVIIPPLPGSPSVVGYTLIPQAVWIIAPIVFYLILLKLKKYQYHRKVIK